MRGRLFCIGVVILLASPASAETCASLYYQRNSIYKDQGYCFTTPRAIRTFGNAGCQYDDVNDVPLSPRQRHVIEQIRSEERFLGCTE